MTAFVVAIAAFAVMEPVTYAAHRFVMHGPGLRLHRSHHRRRSDGRVEANDAFPVTFAALTLVLMAVGFNRAGFELLVPVTVGVSAYGLTYAFVHDVYIHGRLGARRRRVAVLDRLERAHELHHRYGGEPYGMLLPVVPAALRDRARSRQGVDAVPGP